MRNRFLVPQTPKPSPLNPRSVKPSPEDQTLNPTTIQYSLSSFRLKGFAFKLDWVQKPQKPRRRPQKSSRSFMISKIRSPRSSTKLYVTCLWTQKDAKSDRGTTEGTAFAHRQGRQQHTWGVSSIIAYKDQCRTLVSRTCVCGEVHTCLPGRQAREGSLQHHMPKQSHHVG